MSMIQKQTANGGPMTTDPIHLFDPGLKGPAGEPARPVRLAPTTQNEVSLNALLETPTTKTLHRSPLEWAAATGLHIAILATLIIVPLYTTGTIQLSKYEDTPLVAPPVAPPPPPAAAARPVAPHVSPTRPKLTYTQGKLRAPASIPKTVSADNAAAAPDLGGVVGGVSGGVAGGQLGGALGGAFGSTGTAAPPPPSQPQPTKRLVRVKSLLKPPRQTYSVDPEYPPLAFQTRISGTVVIDAIIDERGNVIQASVVSGHPLLIDAALRAVLQWKYEPTSLNGQPVSVELQVQVSFHPKS
jgi:protein TonB